MKYSDRPSEYINAKDLEIAVVKATTYGDALKAVREQPSIDIVRCKECTERDDDWCMYWGNVINLDDFCSYGEREGE